MYETHTNSVHPVILQQLTVLSTFVIYPTGNSNVYAQLHHSMSVCCMNRKTVHLLLR